MHWLHRVLAVLAGVLLTLSTTIAADGVQPIPAFGSRVTDLTHTLTPQQTQTLTDELVALEQRKGSRVAILIVPTTAPEDIAQYSIRVTDAWKLSRTGKQAQDGVLLTVAKDDHRVRIDVGRDLEGAIPDAANARIIREYITPQFRAGDFYGGIHDAVAALTKLIDGESLPPPLTDDHRDSSGRIFNTIFAAIFVIIWLRGFFHWLPSTPRAGLVGAATGGLTWLLSGVLPLAIGAGVLGLLFGWIGGNGGGFAGRGGSGGWGGGSFGSGGSSSGGFSGGFSGGSSGGFSGGGASGSW